MRWILAALISLPFWLVLLPEHPGWYQDQQTMRDQLYRSAQAFNESGHWLLRHHFLGPPR